MNKWYFDEAIDFLIVRPSAWLGRFAQQHDRARVRQRRAGRRLDRRGARCCRPRCAALQSGYLRYYAALLLVGLTGLGAYFLISA